MHLGYGFDILMAIDGEELFEITADPSKGAHDRRIDLV